jgi:hypothetical protein
MKTTNRILAAVLGAAAVAIAAVACSGGGGGGGGSGGSGAAPSPPQGQNPTGGPGGSVADVPLAADIVRAPYLQGTTSSQVTVVWKTSDATDSVIQYGPGLTQTTGNAQASEQTHVVTVGGLAPATTYPYRVLKSGQPASPIASFAAAPPPGSPFTALVFGDSGHDTPGQFQVAQHMTQETPDLLLHTGDVIYPAGEAESYDPLFFGPYGTLLARAPVFPTIGNHDLWDGKGALAYGQNFYFIRNNPAQSKEYYSFEWGDVKFISIETYQLFENRGPHLEWLASELASNTRAWLIVFMHVPLYSVGYHGDDPNLQSVLQPIFEQYKVHLLIAGHDHLYERAGPFKRFSTDPSYPGFFSIVTGGAGADLYPIVKTHPQTLHTESTHHYLKLRFSAEEIDGQVIRADGSTGETFTIPHF